mmetsp:Transcript_31303/g.87784  ORF Transcript_31303/g.87784 Transcript_31303/m.87784 type:complete len:103 (+) Transcript_31303:82-390(+)
MYKVTLVLVAIAIVGLASVTAMDVCMCSSSCEKCYNQDQVLKCIQCIEAASQVTFRVSAQSACGVHSAACIRSGSCESQECEIYMECLERFIPEPPEPPPGY